ncbi:hypothetical protein [Streptomyces sp. NPDC002057]|uniref:hypothetical protein n=1 Tax=Streptomyces sp. NPDC002057 TaxID=3154664 RepID=UPI00332F81A1
MAEAVAARVWVAWGGAYGVEVEHHHIDHPVLPASTPARPPVPAPYCAPGWERMISTSAVTS